MMNDVDIKSFQDKLNIGRLHDPVSEEDAGDALRNLGEFVALLYKINQREKIVPLEELAGLKNSSDAHNR